MAEFKNAGAVVLGCSPDSQEDHRAFIEKYNLQVDLLSDPEKSAMAPFGAWGEKTSGGSTRVGTIRSTVLIRPDGTVGHHWPQATTSGHAAEVLARLVELRS